MRRLFLGVILALIAVDAEAQDAGARGRVVTAAGDPVAGARVILLPPFGVDDGHLAPYLPEALSDAEGRFAVAGLAPPVMESAPYSALRDPALVVLARGFAPRLVLTALGSGGDVGDVTVLDGGRVVGRLVSSEGVGVSGADLRLVRVGRRTDVSWPEWNVWGPFLRARSGTDGQFEFPSVPIGPFRVEARAVGLRPLESAALDPTLGGVTDVGTLRLARGGTIGGRVVDAEGEPLAGARVYAVDTALEVEASEQDPAGLALRLLMDRDPAVTNDSGEFHVAGLGGTVVTLFVDAAGHEPLRMDDVPVGSRDVELRPGRHARLVVQVVDAATEDPVPNARLVATRMLSTESGGRVRPLTIVPLGDPEEALWEVQQAGPWGTWIQASAPGRATEFLEAAGLPAGRHEILTLRVAAGGDIEGYVERPGGGPAAGARVEATDLARSLSPSATVSHFDASAASGVRQAGKVQAVSDAEGHFHIEGLHPAVWLLSVTGEDGSMSEQPVAVGPGERNRLVVGLAARAVAPSGAVARGKPARLRGHVRSAGAPVPGAVVWLTRSGSEPLVRLVDVGELGENDAAWERTEDTLVIAHADGAGAYLAEVPAGAWSQGAASRHGGLSSATDVELSAGEDRALDVELGSGSIEVRVTDALRGEPVAAAWVWLRDGAVPAVAPAVWRTDVEGRCQLQHLSPGSHEVIVVHDRSHGREADEPPAREDRARQTVQVEAGVVAKAELVLPARVSVEGQVTTVAGLPVPDGTLVQAYDVENRPPVLRMETRDGRYRLVGLDEGEWRIFVTQAADIGVSFGDTPGLAETLIELEPGQQLELDFVIGERAAPPARERPLTRAEYFRRRAFDPVAWRDEDEVARGVRIRMIDDLLARHDLTKLTRDEIRELLGKPSDDYANTWVWYLGDERGFFGMDSEWLNIQFDADGRVTWHGITTD